MCAITPGPNIPTITDIEQIAFLRDPVLRNVLITQCYHELSAALTRRTGLGANWCTFATWASKQAGQTIRQEDPARALEAALHTAPAITQALEEIVAAARQIGARPQTGEIQALVWEVLNPLAALQRAGDAVGRGNRKVFEEIAWQFARFFSLCLPTPAFDAEAIDRFCESLRPGEPPAGQGYLRQAFRCYYASFFEPDAKNRAELLLLANIDVGFHEQTRLQPEIAEALSAPVVDPREFTRRLLAAIFPAEGWLAWARGFLRRRLGRLTLLHTAMRTLIAAAQQQVRQIITASMMTISLPHGVRLHLGQDLRAPFPASLREITNPELRALLARLDPTPDSLRYSGAVDWADLPDRLHFIIDLFRGYQQSPDLFEPPFTAEQVTALKAHQLPGGRL